MSLDNLQSNYFGCAETPIWIPDGYDISRIPECKSCLLRIVSPVAGPGTISPRSDGLNVDENPMTTLSVNGIQHNLVECVLMIPGAHRLPSRSEPCVAELACYFRNTNDFTKVVCLCLPIQVGTGDSNRYFSTLGRGTVSGRPLFSSIVPQSAQFLLYRGADLRGRTASNSGAAAFCDPVKQITTHYVCLTPLYIKQEDYQHLVATSGAGRVGPAKPRTPAVFSRLTELCSLVNGIAVGAPTAIRGGKGVKSNPLTDGIPTTSMKCYRLNTQRDIVGGKVFVGGKGAPAPSTLKKELSISNKEIDAGIMPGDLLGWIAGVLAFVVAVLLAAYVTVFVFSTIFTNYKEVQTLYKNPISAAGLTNSLKEAITVK